MDLNQLSDMTAKLPIFKKKLAAFYFKFQQKPVQYYILIERRNESRKYSKKKKERI